MFKRKRIAVLGVSLLAALGLMSVSAAGAQAAEWTVDGKTLTQYQTASFGSEGGPILLTGGGLEFPCERHEIAGDLFANGQGSVYLLFAGCVVLEGEESCQFEDGMIGLQANITLSKDGTYAAFSPLNGGVFGSYRMASVGWEDCLLIGPGESWEEFDVAGDFASEVGPDGVALPLNLSGQIDEESGLVDGLDLGMWGFSHTLIEGTIDMELSGADAGKVLGVS